MGVYDDATRLKYLGLRDQLVARFQEKGLIFAESTVRLAAVTSSATDADDDFGRVVEAAPVYTTLAPRPSVDLRTQWRTRDGATVKIGDALMVVSRTYTREQLEGAAWVEIDGDVYTLAAGELKRDPGGLDWLVILKRERQ